MALCKECSGWLCFFILDSHAEVVWCAEVLNIQWMSYSILSALQSHSSPSRIALLNHNLSKISQWFYTYSND